jgi:hypothetical protein
MEPMFATEPDVIPTARLWRTRSSSVAQDGVHPEEERDPARRQNEAAHAESQEKRPGSGLSDDQTCDENGQGKGKWADHPNDEFLVENEARDQHERSLGRSFRQTLLGGIGDIDSLS